MEKVKNLVRAGAAIPEAIKISLGMSVAEFARKYDLKRSSVANHLNATVRADDATAEALAMELGGTTHEWRELLWQAARPARTVAA